MTALPEVRAAAFTLPATLRADGYRLRAETDDDLPFLMSLYASTREPEMAQLVEWDAAQKCAFVAQQFAAQRHHYRTQLANCLFAVIERENTPVGRLYLAEGQTHWNLVDIALVPTARSGGLGTRIMMGLLAASDRANKAMVLFVERANPAMRWYRRLGFVELRETGFYIEMERPAGRRDPQLNVAQ